MYRVRREGGETNGDIFCALGCRRAVLDPLAGMRDDRLAGANIQNAASVRDPQEPFQDDGELLEFRSLAWLGPTGRTSHVGDAKPNVAGVHSTNVFIDELRLVAGRFNSSRLGY